MTIKEIAKRLDLSPTTVSRVLNGNGKKYRISDKTEKLVLEIAKAHNFSPNLVARGLRLQKTNTIGLVIPDISNPFFASLAKHLETALRRKGKFIILGDTQGSISVEKETIKTLLSRQIDGLLIAPVGIAGQHLETLAALPTVMIDRYFPGGDFAFVSSDNFKGAHTATSYLLGKGHKRVACIQGTVEAVSNKERIRGYKKALEQQGLAFDPSLIIGDDFTIRNGYQAFSKIMGLKPRPTAIFSLGNPITIGLLKAAQTNKVKIPDDISLISFDEQPYFEITSPPITTISQQIEEMGKKAVDILMAHLAGEPGQRSNFIDPILIERSSVAQINPPAN